MFSRPSRNVSPDTGSSLLGVCTREFTSCGFTSFSICFFFFCHESFRSRLFLIRLLTELFTPAWDCSVDTELICWVNCAKQEFRVKWIRIEVFSTSATFFFAEFHGSKHWYWMIRLFESVHHLCSDGIPFSFRFRGVHSVPCFLLSWAEECPVFLARISSRNSWLVRNSKYNVQNVLSLSIRCRWTSTWG